MNKRLILLPALMLAATTLIFTGCSKDEDTTAPVITLNGDALMEIELQESYVEPGATALDGEDGTLAVSITGNVDENLTGDYTISYTATDAAGNTGSAERIVSVINGSQFLAGTYGVLIQTPGFADYTHTDQIKMSTTINNRIIFGKFGDYQGAEDDVYGNVTQFGGSFVSINIPQQTVNCGVPLADRTFTGSGNISVSGATTTISMTINEAIAGQATVTSTYTYTRN